MRYLVTKKGEIIDLKREVKGETLAHFNENEIEGGNLSGWYWLPSNEHSYYECECFDKDIVKKTYTIEELLDCYVAESKVDDDFDVLSKEEFANLKGLYGNYNCYGAIFVKGKGLIYVTKPIERGKGLELK